MILSGKEIAEKIQLSIIQRISVLPRPPGLTMLLIGSYAPSLSYVEIKRKVCQIVGIKSDVITLPENVSEKVVLEKIKEINENPLIDGLLVQFPLPPHLNRERIIEAIDPKKDVDGFHPINMGKLLLGESSGFIPCTPLGIHELLKAYEIPVHGAHVVIVGRSIVVGRPLAALLVQNSPIGNATVTLAHRHTKELPTLTRLADILVVAVGIPNFITAEMVKENSVIIDVGINRVEKPEDPKGWKIVGDVDYEAVVSKCRAITPVPKGVGPMTVAMLMHNTVLSMERRGEG